MVASCIFTCAPALSVLLLLHLALYPGCTTVEDNVVESTDCPNQATDNCIAGLITQELHPVQNLITNGSEQLIFVEQHFVERVWAYVRDSIKEPLTTLSNSSTLVAFDLALSHLYVTWTLSGKKLDELMNNITSNEVNRVCGVQLLEEERAALRRYIELNVSEASRLSLRSDEVLGLTQAMLSVLDSVESELNATLDLVSSGLARIQQQAVNKTRAQDIVDIVLNSTADVVLAMAVKRLELARNTSESVKFIVNKVLQIVDKVGMSMIILDELNTTRDEVGTLVARVTETLLDTLQMVDDLSNKTELLLFDVRRLVNDTAISNVAASQLTQNISLAVNESHRILADYAVFKERLELLEAGADTPLLHTLSLIREVQSITDIGTRFLDEEFLDEFGRLNVINMTASQARAISRDIISDTLSARELVDRAVEAETSASQLVQSIHNISTLPLSTLEPTKNQLNDVLALYNGLVATFLDVLQAVIASKDEVSIIGEGLVSIATQLDNFQSNTNRSREKMNKVSSMIDEFNTASIISEINATTSDVFDSLIGAGTNLSEVSAGQNSLENHLLNLSQSFRDVSDTQTRLSDILARAASLVSTAYTIIDQTEVPIGFGENQTMMIILSPDQLSSPVISGEFRSLAFHFTPSNVSNSTLIHLVASRSDQAKTELRVEIFDAHLRVLFRTATLRGREFLLMPTISETTLQPQRTYEVIISRTEINVHVQLTDLQSSEAVSVVQEASSRLTRAFSTFTFLATATLHVGGASQQQEDAQNYTGCLGSIEINGGFISLWSLATDTGQMELHACVENYRVTGNSGQVQLSFIGRQFAQQRINGSFLPLVVQFKTQLPNGLLFYAHSNSTELVLNSLSVYLNLGRIEMRVTAGDRQRTLTSSQTYNSGALHNVNIELEGSTRLVLKTMKEVVKKRLQMVPVTTLSTYSEVLVGGVGERVREEEGVDESNFTGCVSVFSSSSVLGIPMCYEQETIECSYCSIHEAVFSAEFYGTSFAVFPAFTATEHLDISLSFRTNFADGLILFIGSAAQSMWLAMVLQGGRFFLLFQTESNIPLGFVTGRDLNDSSTHSVTVIRSGMSLSMTVDGGLTNLSPFVFQNFPVGQFSSDLFVGGISQQQSDLLYAGVPWDGFKGHLESIHIHGRALDFSENIASEAVSFVRVDEGGEGMQGQNLQEFYFNGSSFAEFDIGRFAENFSLGFQFSAAADSGLLFYVFSRRREDKMAVQLNHSVLQLYIQESVSDSEWLVSLPQTVTLMKWHDMRITQVGENITLVLDSNLEQQEVVTLPTSLRTTSLLYISGLPSGQRIPTSSSIISDHFTGCLRTHYLSLATRHGVELSTCEGPS